MKTHFMVFGNRNKSVDEKVMIDDKEIEQVKFTKFLGVLIDDQLNWLHHIDNVRKKLSKCIAAIYRVRNLVNYDALVLLYNTLFVPHLNYCSEIWANTYQSNLIKLTVLQKRVIRIINKVSRRYHTSSLFNKMYILKFNDLVKFKSLQILYKAYHNSLPMNLQKYFEVNSTTQIYVTRSKDKFKIKYVRTSLRSKMLSVSGPKLWNTLPKSISSAHSMPLFKALLKRHLINYD